MRAQGDLRTGAGAGRRRGDLRAVSCRVVLLLQNHKHGGVRTVPSRLLFVEGRDLRALRAWFFFGAGGGFRMHGVRCPAVCAHVGSEWLPGLQRVGDEGRHGMHGAELC